MPIHKLTPQCSSKDRTSIYLPKDLSGSQAVFLRILRKTSVFYHIALSVKKQCLGRVPLQCVQYIRTSRGSTIVAIYLKVNSIVWFVKTCSTFVCISLSPTSGIQMTYTTTAHKSLYITFFRKHSIKFLKSLLLFYLLCWV